MWGSKSCRDPLSHLPASSTKRGNQEGLISPLFAGPTRHSQQRPRESAVQGSVFWIRSLFPLRTPQKHTPLLLTTELEVASASWSSCSSCSYNNIKINRDRNGSNLLSPPDWPKARESIHSKPGKKKETVIPTRYPETRCTDSSAVKVAVHCGGISVGESGGGNKSTKTGDAIYPATFRPSSALNWGAANRWGCLCKPLWNQYCEQNFWHWGTGDFSQDSIFGIRQRCKVLWVHVAACYPLSSHYRFLSSPQNPWFWKATSEIFLSSEPVSHTRQSFSFSVTCEVCGWWQIFSGY